MKLKRKLPIPLGLAVTAALVAGVAGQPLAAVAQPQPEAEFRALIFSETEAFVHDSVPDARRMWDELSARNGFDIVQATDSRHFTDAGLSEFDVIVLANTSGDVWNASEEAAFEKFVRGGGGVVAMHNPLDMEQGNTFYRELIGTEFTVHSDASTPGTMNLVDRKHPSNTDVPERWDHREEWYGFTDSVRGDKHILAQLDPTSVPDWTPGRMIDHPVTWCADYEGGRTWITSLGHDPSAYRDATIQKHALGGLRYAAGVAPGDCRATDESFFDKVPLDTDTSAPWGIAVADDGRVFFTELVRGEVRIYDPALESTVTAAQIPVYGGGEDGMLGLALDPDFENNQWVYLYYSPVAKGGNYNPVDGEDFNRLSRFTMDGNEMKLDSEVVVLEVPASRDEKEIGHTGGTLRFDGEGNLWLSVGDDVNPFESQGFTPIDERPGRAHYDAQSTAANTNDLRGKLLRITPKPDGSYAIPEGNMFTPGTDKTRPEIYAMGFRNPFRFSVQPDGTVYLADYGPDSGSWDNNRGPSGYVEWQTISKPGNYGWPYCIADNIPFNDYDFARGVSGDKFTCDAPVNNSPNNTGLTELPPAIPSEVHYSYGHSGEFPQLGAGPTAPMAGPAYNFDPNLDSERKWPEYYDGTPLFFEWGRNYIKEFPLDKDGKVLTINPVLERSDWLAPLDIQFGPDGALYVLEWGEGYGRDNPNSGLYRIDYSTTGRAPTAVVTATPTSGQGPLSVAFSSAGSADKDDDAFTYRWEFGDGASSTEANPTHVYTRNGNYEARLTITEDTEHKKIGTATVKVTVGNTAPVVTITAPENGGFFEWEDILPWQVSVTDAEDNPVSCDDVIVQPALGHDSHAHPELAQRACSGNAVTILDEGHAEADAFWVIDARYTDKGGAPGTEIAPLTGSATSVYRPKRFQAHYVTESSGIVVENKDGAELGQYIGDIQDTDWVMYKDMNFAGIDAVQYRVTAGNEGGGRIEMRLGSPTGQLIAETQVGSTGGWNDFATTAPTAINAPAGTHDVYLVFRSNPGVNWSMGLDVFEVLGQGVGVSPEGSSVSPTLDYTTRGNWIDVYGKLGYAIADGAWALPEGVSVDLAADTFVYTWEHETTREDALQIPPTGAKRLASSWVSDSSTGTGLSIGVPEGQRFSMSLYVESFDRVREQKVRVSRADGSDVAPVRTVSDNGHGVWLTYQIDSSVEVWGTRSTGPNAVFAGVFFDAPVSVEDKTAPTVTFAAPGATESGWHANRPVTATITARDGGSGVEATQYAINNGDWTPYTEPLSFTDDGEYVVAYRASDKAGNMSDVARTTIRLDATAPTVTHTATSVQPGSNWHTQGIELTLTGADTGGSGLAALQYRIGTGAWQDYTEPVRISSEGPNLVQYRAVDVAGNVSALGEVNIEVDSSAPVVEIAVSPEPVEGRISQSELPVVVTVTAGDDVSGVAKIEVLRTTGAAQARAAEEWTEYSEAIEIAELGHHTVQARATDEAGNVSEPISVTFEIVEGDVAADADADADADGAGADADADGANADAAGAGADADADGADADADAAGAGADADAAGAEADADAAGASADADASGADADVAGAEADADAAGASADADASGADADVAGAGADADAAGAGADADTAGAGAGADASGANAAGTGATANAAGSAASAGSGSGSDGSVKPGGANASAGAGDPKDPLATTGAESLSGLWLALGALLIGAASILVSRRRRTAGDG